MGTKRTSAFGLLQLFELRRQSQLRPQDRHRAEITERPH